MSVRRSSCAARVPPMGVVLSWVLLDEALTVRVVAGACLINMGILAVTLAPRLPSMFAKLPAGGRSKHELFKRADGLRPPCPLYRSRPGPAPIRFGARARSPPRP